MCASFRFTASILRVLDWGTPHTFNVHKESMPSWVKNLSVLMVQDGLNVTNGSYKVLLEQSRGKNTIMIFFTSHFYSKKLKKDSLSGADNIFQQIFTGYLTCKTSSNHSTIHPYHIYNTYTHNTYSFSNITFSIYNIEL